MQMQSKVAGQSENVSSQSLHNGEKHFNSENCDNCALLFVENITTCALLKIVKDTNQLTLIISKDEWRCK